VNTFLYLYLVIDLKDQALHAQGKWMENNFWAVFPFSEAYNSSSLILFKINEKKGHYQPMLLNNPPPSFRPMKAVGGPYSYLTF
jgi:hypothetical protein